MSSPTSWSPHRSCQSIKVPPTIYGAGSKTPELEGTDQLDSLLAEDCEDALEHAFFSAPEGPFTEVGVDPDISGAIAILRGAKAPRQPSDFAALTVEVSDAPIRKTLQQSKTTRVQRTLRCVCIVLSMHHAEDHCCSMLSRSTAVGVSGQWS